jgi:hypothetical protein
VSPSSAAAGSFWLDDIQLSGQISPAKDFQETVIIRNDNDFALSPTDGVEIYRGNGETCVDNTASLSKTYYYAAFAADDRGNWSEPDTSAQWHKTADINTTTSIPTTTAQPQKMMKNQQILIQHDNQYYTDIGQLTD